MAWGTAGGDNWGGETYGDPGGGWGGLSDWDFSRGTIGNLWDAGSAQARAWESANPGMSFDWGSNAYGQNGNMPGYGYGGYPYGSEQWKRNFFGMAQNPTPQQQMWQWMSPLLQGLFSGNSYDIPDVGMMMPTEETMSDISPDVWEGIMYPYKQAEQQLMETLGAGGALGSARGGFSGQGAAGVGKYWAEATPNIGTTAWGMIGPQLQQNWEAQLQKNMYPYTLAGSLVGGTYPTPIIKGEGASGLEEALGYASLASSIIGGIGGFM